MEITFDHHPHRTDVHGESVPTFPDIKMIRINGIQAGYCGAGIGNEIHMVRNYPESVMAMVRSAVEREISGGVSEVRQPPNVMIVEESIDDDGEYEDEVEE